VTGGSRKDFGSAIDSYGILDSSISYDMDSWQLSLFARNLRACANDRLACSRS
jgi:hypothetical protein